MTIHSQEYETAKANALGSIGKQSDTCAKKRRKSEARIAAYAAKRMAAKLLRSHDSSRAKRLAHCGYTAFTSDVGLIRSEYANGEVKAGFNGLVTCKLGWLCPVCGPRKAQGQVDKLNHLLGWARSQGHSVLMLTLTARHNRETELLPFLKALKGASADFKGSNGFKRKLGWVGHVTATEFTHSFAAAWHPHQHVLLVLPQGEADALALVESLRGQWLKSLKKYGLTGNQAAFQVQSGNAAGQYVGKWSAGAELALGHAKAGRSGSRNPWQLLADARDGDKVAGALWVEFAMASRGLQQLVWSKGLEALCGANEIESEEEMPVETVALRSWSGNSEHWRMARRRKCSILSAAESGGDIDAAEYGATDAQKWREHLAESDVLEEIHETGSPGGVAVLLKAGPDTAQTEKKDKTHDGMDFFGVRTVAPAVLPPEGETKGKGGMQMPQKPIEIEGWRVSACQIDLSDLRNYPPDQAAKISKNCDENGAFYVLERKRGGRWEPALMHQRSKVDLLDKAAMLGGKPDELLKLIFGLPDKPSAALQNTKNT